MTSAKGSLDFFKRLYVVGTVLRVERIYFGGQFASGDGVTLDYTDQPKLRVGCECQRLTFGGRMIRGGGRSSSETLSGEFMMSVG